MKYRYVGEWAGFHSVTQHGRTFMMAVQPGMEPVELDNDPGSHFELVTEPKEKPARKTAAKRPAKAEEE